MYNFEEFSFLSIDSTSTRIPPDASLPILPMTPTNLMFGLIAKMLSHSL